MHDITFRPGRIADPIHGYISFTGIENVILDHPVAQRLRYVSQTGLLHLVYPEARTSRFIHSLGAMHLGSAFLTACLRNANDETKHSLGEALRTSIDAIAGKTVRAHIVGAELKDQPLSAWHHCSSGHEPYFLIAEQSLRLAALFHDLGHLPFSHDFETALESYWLDLKEKQSSSRLQQLLEPKLRATKIHERLSHEIARFLLQDKQSELSSTKYGAAARISIEFALCILTASNKPTTLEDSAVSWLHSLVDGEIDCDRCDYLLRDKHSLGFGFVDYDLERLVDNLVVIVQNNQFLLVIDPRGIGPVESFLISRYRSYQYGVRHHKVVQVGAALIDSISTLLSKENKAIGKFIEDISFLANASSSKSPDRDTERDSVLKRFVTYDDNWFMQMLRDEAEATSDEWLQLICWRQRGPVSLWKWKGELSDLLSTLEPPRDIKTWNSDLVKARNEDEVGFDRLWHDTVSKLKGEGVLIARHHFTPWRIDPKTVDDRRPFSGHSLLSVQQKDGKIVAVSELSPLIHALQDAWNADLQIHAFAKEPGISKKEVLDRLSSVGDTVLEAVSHQHVQQGESE